MILDPEHELCVCPYDGVVQQSYSMPIHGPASIYKDYSLRKFVAQYIRDSKMASKFTGHLAMLFPDEEKVLKYEYQKVVLKLLIGCSIKDKKLIEEVRKVLKEKTSVRKKALKKLTGLPFACRFEP